jgi:hypothetical protein
VRALRCVLLAWLLPVYFSCATYYGYSTAYTTRVFSERSFRKHYEKGVYRYRVLGRWTFLATHDLIQRTHLPSMLPRSIAATEGKRATAEIYTAYCVHNTFFLCLACTVLFFLLERRRRTDGFIVDVALAGMALLMAVTGYVVVPYDTMSYFFIAAAAALVLRAPGPGGFAALCAALALATLTRESSVVILALYAAVHLPELVRWRRSGRRHLELLLLGLVFVAVYGGLRVALGGGHGAVTHGSVMAKNLHRPLAWIGLGAFLAFVAWCLADAAHRRRCAWFLVLCAPYLVTVTIVGLLWETRLFMPVMLPLLLLKLEPLAPRAPAPITPPPARGAEDLGAG